MASSSFLYSAASALVSSVGSRLVDLGHLDPQRGAGAGGAGADVGALLTAHDGGGPRRRRRGRPARSTRSRRRSGSGRRAAARSAACRTRCACAASTAARAASSSSIGTTIPGSTIGSLTNSTGTDDWLQTFNPPKFSLIALNPGRGSLCSQRARALRADRDRRADQQRPRSSASEMTAGHTVGDVDGQRKMTTRRIATPDQQPDAPHR